MGWVDVVALALLLLTGVSSWYARYVLNPDGVSYLDLAGRLSAGDWGAFVQGYWSPLYPMLIAILSAVGGETPKALLIAAHLVNALAITGAILLLWRWGRQGGGARFATAALAALFLVSAGIPRTEAVTPDTLLLALMVWLGHELLAEGGRRWARTGLLLGLTFLVKTSAWPWLLLSIPLRLWGAPDREGRRVVLRSLPVTLGVMLLWVVPLSLKAGHPTIGSAGRLNYCWYIYACDSQTPDKHLGRHVAYHEAPVDSSRAIVWAEFDTTRWTYEPWSDPTAWEAGVLTRSAIAPKPDDLVRYWGRQARRSFLVWLLPVFAGILLPWSLFEWRPERRRWWLADGRPVLVVALLGLAGVFQFILIHAEPRLIAPYGMLVALAVLHRGADPAEVGLQVLVRRVGVWLGLVQVAWFGTARVREGIDTGRRLDQIIATMEKSKVEMAADGLSQARIVVLGPAIPVAAGAFLSGSRIVAQVLPGSADLLDRLSVEERRLLLTRLFGGKVQIGWRSSAEGDATFVVIPPK